MHTFNTERLLLRPINISDIDDIYEYSKTSDVGPNAGWKPHKDKNETLEIMKMLFIEKEDIWGIILKDYNKLIGSIGFRQDPKRQNVRSRMVGYAIGKKYWGHGYTTEALQEILRYGFNNLNLDIISANCYPHNERSKRVLFKCNFKYEGTLRLAEILYNGEIYGHECYSITSQEYFKI